MNNKNISISTDALNDAISEIKYHDSLELIDKLHDCQLPKYERLLRNLVKSIKEKTL